VAPVQRSRAAVAPADWPAPTTADVCDVEHCPCLTGSCTLSRVARAVEGRNGAMAGQHTLRETERAVSDRLSGMDIDLSAMAAVSNLYRAASALRNHFERTVLAPHELTWTGWVVLWVVWIWNDIEARHVAAEAGISKGTLTGVAGTLERRGLLRRRTHPDDARRVLLSLTPAGRRLMKTLFPLFNGEESRAVGSLTPKETQALATSLRKVVIALEATVGEPDGPATRS
jgi:MarR family transcriptional regulator, organic hydroperoxide resistance regulator